MKENAGGEVNCVAFSSLLAKDGYPGSGYKGGILCFSSLANQMDLPCSLLLFHGFPAMTRARWRVMYVCMYVWLCFMKKENPALENSYKTTVAVDRYMGW